MTIKKFSLLIFFCISHDLGVEAIDWAVEISLSERCAEKKQGNYHAWNHRQWVLQKAPNLLVFELIKTERFMKKNIADYSCYHHRHFVLMKLFDQQYYDIHSPECFDDLSQLIQKYSNEGGNNISSFKDLKSYLLPNPDRFSDDKVNVHKLRSFLFCVNLVAHDILMIQELKELFGHYEAFDCYKRIIIKFAIDIIELTCKTDYLLTNAMAKPNLLMDNEISHSNLIQLLMSFYDPNSDDKFKLCFFKP